MTEAEWLACDDPKRMLDGLNRPSERKLTLFCVASGWMGGPIDPAEREARYEVAEQVLAGQQPFTVLVRLFWQNYEEFPRFRPVPMYLADIAVAARLPHHPANRPDADRLRDIFGNPFRPVTFSPEWRTDTAVALARQMYESRDFSAMPILADALQDAGCDSDDILAHCRDPKQVHVRGCWVVDLVLGKS